MPSGSTTPEPSTLVLRGLGAWSWLPTRAGGTCAELPSSDNFLGDLFLIFPSALPPEQRSTTKWLAALRGRGRSTSLSCGAR